MQKIGRLGAYLICVLAIFMIAEFGWLLSDHRRQELLHQEKLARIEAVRDSMTENVGLYRRLVSRLSVMNRQVLALLADKPEEASAYLTDIEKAWNDEYARRVLEVLDFVKVPETRQKVLNLLSAKTGIETVADANQRYNWLGNRLPAPAGASLADYSDFKAILYHRLDPRFLLFFAENPPCDLRLDQVRWNGAMLDGLPPLRDPKMLEARAALLKDSDRVYSAVVDGRAIACPRSILLWHELALSWPGEFLLPSMTPWMIPWCSLIWARERQLEWCSVILDSATRAAVCSMIRAPDLSGLWLMVGRWWGVWPSDQEIK